MPLRSFENFKLTMSLHRKEFRGAPKARGPRSWPIWPMRKSVTGHMTSSESITCLVEHDICFRLSPMDQCCHGFSAGRLLAASCLHCVNYRLNR